MIASSQQVHRAGAGTRCRAPTMSPRVGTARPRLVCSPTHLEFGTAAAAGAIPGGGSDDLSSPSSSGHAGMDAAAKQPKNLWQKIKYFFVGDGLDKERLKALGMGAFASYGVISNLNYGTCLGVAWLAFVKKTGMAPTAPGQWPAFLAFYAGLWAMQNFARPLRLSLALALAPAFDKAIVQLAAFTGLDKKWAFGLFILAIGICTSTILFGSLYLLGGFPPSPAVVA